MEPLTGKRRRPTSVSLSPPPPPRQPTHEDEKNRSWKKRRLEPSTEEKRPELRRPEPEEKKATPTTKRRRSVSPEKTQEIKRRRVEEGASPPPVLPASPVANLTEKDHREHRSEEREEVLFPPPPIVIPTPEEQSKENRENVATFTNLEEFIVSSQGSDADLVAACSNLDNDVNCSQDSQHSDVERNPPPPPKRPKRRRNYGGIVYARTYPRLALTPLIDDSPPSSPRVFRSLENEFAFAMQDTPEIRPRVRPAPRMARGTRRSTRAGLSRARRSLDTPTSTMVLRSRQLNPSLSADGGKPENQREREQRDAQRRHD
ncbi:hypothetical protein PHMEG_00021744 [Phytophthora megakarya]|uniref:Uncharacterized protein n=1 Tax=Phytophthora megakarya TaxID=4795 RepID=A0A225VKH8_9STRA|nr:hypothetical protein PHMEG_00021744 [Phytophthora megakarya]